MRIVLVLILLISISFNSFSQTNKQTYNDNKPSKKEADTVNIVEPWSAASGTKYGIRGGYNISNLDFEGQSFSGNTHRNSIYIGFLANIGLSKRFSLAPEIQFSAEGANTETLHLDYIQIPILFRFRLSERLHLGLGPQFGWKVYKAEDDLKDFAYSTIIGADYNINHAVFLEVRYNYGVISIFDDALGIIAKNRNIQLGVGYKF